MEILRSLDFFGSYLHWYVNQKKKVYTRLGGILSVISIVICFIVLVYLLSGIINRKNPQTTEEEQSINEYQIIKFGEENIYIPWTIADYRTQNVNFTGWLYPIIYYFNTTKNKKTGEMIFDYKILNYRYCNETNINNLEYFKNNNIDFNNYYCIEMEDHYIGGSKFHDFEYHVQMDFNLCEEGVNIGTPGKKCTDFEKLDEYIGENNNWHIEFYFPEIQFKPKSIEKPIEIVYSSRFYNFNKFNTKVERLYLKQFSLIDDQGWIFEKKKNSSNWGLDRIDHDSYTRSFDGKDLISDFTSSKIYSLIISLNINKKLFTRKYIKLLESLGNIITLVQSIFTIFKYLSQFFTEAYQDSDIVKDVFVQKYFMNEKFSRFSKSKDKSNREKCHSIDIINSDQRKKIRNLVHVPYSCYSPQKQNQEINNDNNFKRFSLFNKKDKQILQKSSLTHKYKGYRNSFEPSELMKRMPQTSPIKENNLINNYNQENIIIENNNDADKSNIKFDIQKNLSMIHQKTYEMDYKSKIYRHLNQIKRYLGKDSNNESNKKKKKYRSKDFNFPYYLYLLNIFNNRFAMKKTCCVNKKFENSWKYMIKVFDVTNYIQIQTNVDLLNKIIFEMEKEGLESEKAKLY